MNKTDRENKEIQNLVRDPRYTRQLWQSIGLAIARRPAAKPIIVTDKDGNETPSSLLERYSFDSLKNDIQILQDGRTEPTELEVIMACQMRKARTDTGAAIFIRDTLGARPVDESKVQASVSNQYETLTDEELELLAAHRKELALQTADKQVADSVRTRDEAIQLALDAAVADPAVPQEPAPTDTIVDADTTT